jgi:hypothetical protein
VSFGGRKWRALPETLPDMATFAEIYKDNKDEPILAARRRKRARETERYTTKLGMVASQQRAALLTPPGP